MICLQRQAIFYYNLVMSVIDDYLEEISEPQKSELQRIRRVILQAVPDAEEVMTYGMPGFKYKGKYLISFANFKDHMSIFPGSAPIEHYKNQLKNYKISKGTIQFTLENPISDTLLTKIIKSSSNEINKRKP